MEQIKKAIDRTLDCAKVGALLLFCFCSADAQSGSKADSSKAPGAAPKKFALVIGIDKYEISPLFGCVKDAEKFRDALVNYGGFRREDIEMLTDKAGKDPAPSDLARGRVLRLARPVPSVRVIARHTGLRGAQAGELLHQRASRRRARASQCDHQGDLRRGRGQG